VEKAGGSSPAEFIYFNGKPVALYNPASGAWTDLLWAGNNLLAEVAGTQAATPEYRLLDHEGSLVATTDGSGNVTGTNLMLPYGETISSNTNDPYAFAGLYQDTEYAGDDARYRNYSTEPSRWLTPDPYNGSYDLMNPQSFNRYMYVNGNPLGFTDPSGLTFGILNGVGGGICKADSWQWNGTVPIGNGALGINPCNPVGSLIADGVVAAVVYAEYADGAITAASYGNALLSFKGSDTYMGTVAAVGAAITVFCSIDHNNALCGPTGGISYLIGGDVGKVVNDSLSVGGAVACLAVPGGWGCLGDAIYQAINGLLTALFGPPQFTGSLLPRPSDLGGLGTAPIGIPNQNLTVQQLLGSQSRSAVPSPGMVHP
ncbi:MAG: RHS repeat domain-containing protein, partial [Acidobacteriaceae bacterium]